MVVVIVVPNFIPSVEITSEQFRSLISYLTIKFFSGYFAFFLLLLLQLRRIFNHQHQYFLHLRDLLRLTMAYQYKAYLWQDSLNPRIHWLFQLLWHLALQSILQAFKKLWFKSLYGILFVETMGGFAKEGLFSTILVTDSHLTDIHLLQRNLRRLIHTSFLQPRYDHYSVIQLTKQVTCD